MRARNGWGRLAVTCGLFALCVCGVSPLGATVYMQDPVVTGGTGCYTAGSSLAGQTGTNSTVGVSGAWGTGTGVFLADATGLSYPSNILLTAAGGSFTLKNTATSLTGSSDGRVLTRNLSGVPSSGILYLGLLLRAEDQALTTLGVGQSYGAGVGTNSASGTTTPVIPTDGVYFGFYRNASGRALVLNVRGANYTLVAGPASNTTYYCVAKIAFGAGAGGLDVVSAAVNPSGIEEYVVSVETNVVLSGMTLSRLRLGGVYATAGQAGFL